MIRASICFPAILEGKQEEFKILERAATYVGLAFQIKDDILDIEGNFEDLGKEVGKDEVKNKATFVSYIQQPLSVESREQMTNECSQNLDR